MPDLNLFIRSDMQASFVCMSIWMNELKNNFWFLIHDYYFLFKKVGVVAHVVKMLVPIPAGSSPDSVILDLWRVFQNLRFAHFILFYFKEKKKNKNKKTKQKNKTKQKKPNKNKTNPKNKSQTCNT